MQSLEKSPNTQLQVKPDISLSNFRYNCMKIIRYLPGVIKNGTPEHFFMIEANEVEKTSFIKYVAKITEDNFSMTTVHIRITESSTEELIIKMIKKLSDEFENTLIDRYLKKIFEIKNCEDELTLEKQTILINEIKGIFSKLLIEICENNRIFLIIDNVNELSDNIEFANWYKSLFESIYFNNYHVPLALMLISNPEEFNNLCLINESFTRMFKLIEIF